MYATCTTVLHHQLPTYISYQSIFKSIIVNRFFSLPTQNIDLNVYHTHIQTLFQQNELFSWANDVKIMVNYTWHIALKFVCL